MPDRIIGEERKSNRRWWVPTSMLLCLLVLWIVMFTGGQKAALAWYLLQVLGLVLGPLTLLVLIGYAIRRRRFSLPLQLSVLISLFATWPLLWAIGILRIPFPSSPQDALPGVTVRLPSDHRLMVAAGGSDLRHNHHAWYPNQRWAYDLTVEPAFPSSRLEDFGCYGTAVLAPVSGLVAHTTNDLPDLTPGTRGDARNPYGNFVVIKLDATETYLLIAHLQRHSIRVHAGDRVREGDVLAACGNSGNTNGPHIHIHHQRQDPMTTPSFLAEGLPLYFKDLDGAAMPRGGFEMRNRRSVFIGEYVRSRIPVVP